MFKFSKHFLPCGFCFEFRILVISYCFEFRASGFGFIRSELPLLGYRHI